MVRMVQWHREILALDLVNNLRVEGIRFTDG